MIRAEMLAHARTRRHQRLVAAARECIEAMPATKSAVAFSGGKDSSVLLHLVRAVTPDTLAFTSDQEYCLPETRQLLDETRHLARIARENEHADFFTCWADGRRPDDPRVEWVDDGIPEWLHRHGYDGIYLGLRADENNYRRVHLARRGDTYRHESRDLWHCCPLARWGVRDVWAYIYSRHVPYNRAYDRLTEIGVSLERQRIGPYAQRRALPFGQLAVLRRGWPEEFARFAAAHPEAKAYT